MYFVNFDHSQVSFIIFFPYTFDLIIRLDGVDIHFSLLLLYILIVTHVEEQPSGVGTRLGWGWGEGCQLAFLCGNTYRYI